MDTPLTLFEDAARVRTPMPTIRYSQSADIAAPPARVYGIIADYKVGHPSILPARYFDGLDVLEGGVGAGTRIRFTMLAMGKRNTAEALVTEPEPGRRLLETTTDGLETEFLVEPRDGGKASRVTFTTRYERAGLQGLIERLIVPGFLRKVYTAELAQLGRVATAA